MTVNIESPAIDLTGDITQITEKLEELKEVLSEEKEPEKVLVGETEMTSNDLLVEIMQKLEPDNDQKDLSNEMATTQQATLDDLLITTEKLLEKTEAQIIQLDQQQQLTAEGAIFNSLAIVISFAVYMLWSQLSKW